MSELIPRPEQEAAGPRERMQLLVRTGAKGWRVMPTTERQRFMVEEYMKCYSVEEVARRHNERFAKWKVKPIRGATVKRWLGLERVQAYLKEKLEASGYLNRYKGKDGEAIWMQELLQYREGLKHCSKTTLEIMRMIGLAQGWMRRKESAEASLNIKNMQINFTQANGEK